MTSEERHEARYQRRKAARQAKIAQANAAVGTLETALSYSALYEAGKAACKGVRWKTSTKKFELRCFSRTARTRRRLINGTWKTHKPCTFYIMERGHKRKIDAPHIDDRQVHKAVCRKVLRPLYYPHMIYDNGASIENKGFSFTVNRVVTFLQWWYNRYGMEGIVVSYDFKGYFPNAPHSTIERHHSRYILDYALRSLCDYLLNAFGPVGMALGVETSQTEAGILPNAVDHLLKDQCRTKCLERYMDDTTFIARSYTEADEKLNFVRAKCLEEGLKMNEAKTHKTPLSGWFTFCQWKYHVAERGRVIKKPSRKSVTAMGRKLKAFGKKYSAGEMTLQQVCDSYQSWKSYALHGNAHNVILKMDRKFYRLFGFYHKTKKEKKL